MPIRTKIKDDILLPEQGDYATLFERLFQYINLLDNDWKGKIRPASIEQIERLRKVSQLGRYHIDFPIAYRIYLETMGVDDGGLLSKFFNGGTANIDKIIQIYNDFHESEPEELDTPYLVFFWRDWGGDVRLDLSGNHADNVLGIQYGESYKTLSESFEKMMFQAAFKAFEIYKNYLDFGGSIAGLRAKMQPDEVIPTLNRLCLRYGLKKLWISDKKWFIARGDAINFWVDCDDAICGRITGEDEKKVKGLFLEFGRLFGVK